MNMILKSIKEKFKEKNGRAIELNLKSSTINHDDLIELQSILNGNPITALNLKDNAIYDDSCDILAELLIEQGNLGQLKELNIAKNGFSSDAFNTLINAIKTIKSLEFLDVRYTNMIDKTGAKLIFALNELPNLKSIRLDSNLLGKETEKAIAELLEKNPNINISAAWTQISPTLLNREKIQTNKGNSVFFKEPVATISNSLTDSAQQKSLKT